MGQEVAKIIIKTPDGKDVDVSTASLPLTIVYEYQGKQKIYTLKATKNNKLLMNWFVLIRAVNI